MKRYRLHWACSDGTPGALETIECDSVVVDGGCLLFMRREDEDDDEFDGEVLLAVAPGQWTSCRARGEQ